MMSVKSTVLREFVSVASGYTLPALVLRAGNRTEEQKGTWNARLRTSPDLPSRLASPPSPGRNAPLLRFFEDRRLAIVGAALGLTEDAARIRVMHALRKMLRVLIEPGSAISVTVIAGLLSESAVRIAAWGAVATELGRVLAGWHEHHLTQDIKPDPRRFLWPFKVS